MTKGLANKRLWTVKEAAKELRLSEKTIRRLIKAGTINARQYGREYRIPHDEVTGYKSSGSV